MAKIINKIAIKLMVFSFLVSLFFLFFFAAMVLFVSGQDFTRIKKDVERMTEPNFYRSWLTLKKVLRLALRLGFLLVEKIT